LKRHTSQLSENILRHLSTLIIHLHTGHSLCLRRVHWWIK